MTDFVSLQRRLRDSLWLVAAEFAIVAALFVADIYHHIYIKHCQIKHCQAPYYKLTLAPGFGLHSATARPSLIR